MGIDPSPLWANLFLYFLESKHIKKLISNESSNAYEYHRVSRFINELCAINNYNKFLTPFKNICFKKLELRVEHQGNYTSFLDFDIKIEDCFRI